MSMLVKNGRQDRCSMHNRPNRCIEIKEQDEKIPDEKTKDRGKKHTLINKDFKHSQISIKVRNDNV